MKKLITTSFTILLFFVSLSLIAQSSNGYLKKAKSMLKDGNPWGAYPALESAVEEDGSNTIAKFYKGVCEILLETPQKALETFNSLDESALEGEKVYHHWLGRAYFANGDFDKALRSFELYLASGDNELQAETQKYIENIKNAKQVYNSPKKLVVENLGTTINSNFQDYNALVTADHKGIIFTSKRDGNLGEKTGKGQNFEDMLRAMMDDNGNWSNPEVMTGLSTTGHDAGVQLFNNDKSMIIYQEGDLFITEMNEDETWSEPKSLGSNINNKKSFESHAFISADGQLIVFSSNHKTANGDLDLFMATKSGNGWGNPTPITALNTPLNEDAPFIGDDGMLYFSSEGHNSIGGYDVFKSRYDDVNLTWGAPENMGYPINSVLDDIFFSLYEEIGYLTSNRIGGHGMEDIYRIYMFSTVKLNGTIANKDDNLPIPNAMIKFVEKDGGETYEATANAAGMFSLDLPFNTPMTAKVFVEGEIKHEESFMAKVYVGVPKEMQKKFYTDLGKGDNPENLGMGENGDNSLVSNDALEKFVKSITPSEGSKAMVAGRIMEKGTKKPLTAKVELVNSATGEVLATTIASSNGLYFVDVLDDALNYEIRASYASHLTENKSINLATARDNVVRADIALAGTSIGQTFVFERIYFNFNQSVIREVSYDQLDKVADFIQENPNLSVEVAGHSDNIGTPEYNQVLSERRARNVVNYLVKKGVDGSKANSQRLRRRKTIGQQ